MHDKELQQFKQGLDANGDNVISKREANKFLKANGLDKDNKQELLQLLQNYNKNTEDVDDVNVVEHNGEKAVAVKYKDGSVETINLDRSSEVVATDEDGTTTTKNIGSDGVLDKEVVEDKDGNKVETEFEEDGETKSKEVKTTSEGEVTTVAYEEGKQKTKEVKQGITTTNYKYDENGKELLDTRIENEGIEAKERHSTFTYNDDGTITENVTYNGGTAVRQLKEDAKTPLSEEIKEDGKVKKKIYRKQ